MQGGNLGWSGAGGKWAFKESFREEAPPLPSPSPQSLTGLLKCVLLRRPVRWWVEEGKISRSCLRDWNPQRLSSRHMLRSIPSTAPAPVTLRLPFSTHPPPTPHPSSVRGSVSVLLTHCHSPPSLAFPFPPLVFFFFFSEEHLVLYFHPPRLPLLHFFP